MKGACIRSVKGLGRSGDMNPPTSPRASSVWQSRVSAHVFMTDTTIPDHSRVFLSILRAPQRNLISENRRPPSNWSPGFCAMLGPGKRANHTIGVAKIEEFVYTRMVRTDTTILDHSRVFKHAQEPTMKTRAPLHPLKILIYN